MSARVDLPAYAAACEVLENFKITAEGPAEHCGGTVFVAASKDPLKRARLIAFKFSTVQAYILEFGDQYIRFYANHGQVVTSGVAAYNGATGYIIGDLVASGGINYYAIAPTTGNAPPGTPHLHFAVFVLGAEKHWWEGTPIDPLPLFKD
jgi:hypothetical protein